MNPDRRCERPPFRRTCQLTLLDPRKFLGERVYLSEAAQRAVHGSPLLTRRLGARRVSRRCRSCDLPFRPEGGGQRMCRHGAQDREPQRCRRRRHACRLRRRPPDQPPLAYRRRDPRAGRRRPAPAARAAGGAHLLGTHGGPNDRAALERALSSGKTLGRPDDPRSLALLLSARRMRASPCGNASGSWNPRIAMYAAVQGPMPGIARSRVSASLGSEPASTLISWLASRAARVCNASPPTPSPA
jgi:hypothetical protein